MVAVYTLQILRKENFLRILCKENSLQRKWCKEIKENSTLKSLFLWHFSSKITILEHFKQKLTFYQNMNFNRNSLHQK